NSYLPLKETATLLGKSVNWNEGTHSIDLKSSTESSSSNTGSPANTSGGSKMSTTSDYKIIESNGKQYIKIKDFSDKYMTMGYSIPSDNRYPSKGVFLSFNNEPNGDISKTKILLENIQSTVIDGESYFEQGYFDSTILPLLK